MPVPQRIVIERPKKVPAAFAEAFAKLNAALTLLQAIANAEGKGGIKITKSETNWIIEGGGLPPGFEEKTFTICEDGEPVDVILLVKRIPSE